MSTSIFEQVRTALNPRLSDVLQDLLPGGKISGREYVCGSLQGGAGTSCSTSLDTGKGGDFATGDSWGDIIALAAKVWGMRQGEAAQEIAKRYGLGAEQRQHAKCQQPVAEFSPILPIPDTAPEPPHSHPQHGTASALWCYRNQQGQPLAYVSRFDLPDGEKVVLPLCYGQSGTGRQQWHWKALPEPRPLYNLPVLTALPEPREMTQKWYSRLTDAWSRQLGHLNRMGLSSMASFL